MFHLILHGNPHIALFQKHYQTICHRLTITLVNDYMLHVTSSESEKGKKQYNRAGKIGIYGRVLARTC
jgi:hypothetical protein